MSGSSSSSRTRWSPGSLASVRTSDSRAAVGRERGHCGLLRTPQLPGPWQLDVEALGADVRERLGAQGGVEDVGRDLGVEDDSAAASRRSGSGSSRACGSRRDSSHTSSGLTSWPASGLPAVMTASARRTRAVRPGRDHPAVVAPDGQPKQRASTRSHIVEGRTDGQLRLGRQPRGHVVGGAQVATMPGSRENGPQLLHGIGPTRCTVTDVAGRTTGRLRGSPTNGVEVEAHLEPAALTQQGAAPRRAAGDLRRRARAQTGPPHATGRRARPRPRHRPPAAAPRGSGTRTPGRGG